MKHGFGIAKSKCGTIYKGFWENDKKEGWGIEQTHTGATHEGYFKDDKRVGKC